MEINGAGFTTPLQDISIQAPEKGDFYGLTIAISEKSPNTSPWVIDVDAQFKNGGRLRLGGFATTPSSSGAAGQAAGGNFAQRQTPPARIVAIAAAPGAIGWWIRCAGAVGAQADLFLQCGRGYGAQGLTPLSWSGQTLSPVPYRADRNPALAASRVVIPNRARLWGFKGLRSAGAGTAFFQAFDSATVPAAGTPADFVEPVLPGATFLHPIPFGPTEVSNGIAWAISSTADVFTPTNNAELWVRTYFD